jgi:hypothetical protein
MTPSEAVFAAAELSEARVLLRFASEVLTDTERAALSALATEMPGRQAAASRGNITRGGIWMAQQSGLRKMRRRLESLGIKSVEQVL